MTDLADSLEKDYQTRIHKPISIILQDYDTLVDVATTTTQYAEKYRRECLITKSKNKALKSHNKTLLDELEAVTDKYTTAVAKHNIAKSGFQRELRELENFRDQRDNFYEIIQLCKELLSNDNLTIQCPVASSGASTTDSDTASLGPANDLRSRLSVAQMNKLKQFNPDRLYEDEDFMDHDSLSQSFLRKKSRGNMHNSHLHPSVTPRHGRPLAIIDESKSFDVTFDSEPDTEPDHHSTGLGEVTQIMMPSQQRLNESRLIAHTVRNTPGYPTRGLRKRYSSDAVLSTATLSTGESSSLAAGADAGLYVAKKNVVGNGTRRRPSNGFRRRSQNLNVAQTPEGIAVDQTTGHAKYWPSDSSTPMAVPRTEKKSNMKKRSREPLADEDLTPTRDNINNYQPNYNSNNNTNKQKFMANQTKIKQENIDNIENFESKPTKKIKITPPNNKKPPIAVPVTPMAKKELTDVMRNLKRRHEWVHKTGVVTGPKCAITNKKIRFNKAMWRCARCGMVVHPDSFDQGDKTSCTAVVVKQPSTANLRKQVSQEFLTSLSHNHHNILLTIEEIERRRAIVCEGIYRIPGNIREKNMLVSKIIDSGNSLTTKRKILASMCKDHNSLCSLLKHYLSESEPILTFSLLPKFSKVATDENLPAADRQRQVSQLLESLPANNLQILAQVLKHLNHVIDNRHVNKMSDEGLARSIAPSLIGYTSNSPSNKELQTAHHYQRNVSLILLSLPSSGNCVLGRAMKKLEDRMKQSTRVNLDKSAGGTTVGAGTPMIMRRMFGMK